MNMKRTKTIHEKPAMVGEALHHWYGASGVAKVFAMQWIAFVLFFPITGWLAPIYLLSVFVASRLYRMNASHWSPNVSRKGLKANVRCSNASPEAVRRRIETLLKHEEWVLQVRSCCIPGGQCVSALVMTDIEALGLSKLYAVVRGSSEDSCVAIVAYKRFIAPYDLSDKPGLDARTATLLNSLIEFMSRPQMNKECEAVSHSIQATRIGAVHKPVAARRNRTPSSWETAIHGNVGLWAGMCFVVGVLVYAGIAYMLLSMYLAGMGK